MAAGGHPSNYKHVETDEDYEAYLQSAEEGQLFVAYFSQERCSHCITMNVTFNLMTEKYPKVLFAQVEAMKCIETTIESGLWSTPSIIFIKDKQEIDRLEGAQPPQLEPCIIKCINTPAPTTPAVVAEPPSKPTASTVAKTPTPPSKPTASTVAKTPTPPSKPTASAVAKTPAAVGKTPAQAAAIPAPVLTTPASVAQTPGAAAKTPATAVKTPAPQAAIPAPVTDVKETSSALKLPARRKSAVAKGPRSSIKGQRKSMSIQPKK